jgi:hypothetical protein
MRRVTVSVVTMFFNLFKQARSAFAISSVSMTK